MCANLELSIRGLGDHTDCGLERELLGRDESPAFIREPDFVRIWLWLFTIGFQKINYRALSNLNSRTEAFLDVCY